MKLLFYSIENVIKAIIIKITNILMGQIMKELEYSYVQYEKNKEMVVFIKINPELLDKDLYFDVIDNKFVMKVDNDTYESEVIESSLLERMNKMATPIMFANKEGDLISELNFPAIQTKKLKP